MNTLKCNVNIWGLVWICLREFLPKCCIRYSKRWDQRKIKGLLLESMVRYKLPQDQKNEPFDLQTHWKERVERWVQSPQEVEGQALYQKLVKEVHQNPETSWQPSHQGAGKRFYESGDWWVDRGKRRVGPNTKEMFSASASCKTKWASFFLRVLPSVINSQPAPQPTSCRMQPEPQPLSTLKPVILEMQLVRIPVDAFLIPHWTLSCPLVPLLQGALRDISCGIG